MSKELSVYSLVNWLIQFKVLDAVVKLVQLSDKLGLDPFPGGAIVRTAFDHFSYAKLVHGGCRRSSFWRMPLLSIVLNQIKGLYANNTGSGRFRNCRLLVCPAIFSWVNK
jgi:hypothetical protein